MGHIQHQAATLAPVPTNAIDAQRVLCRNYGADVERHRLACLGRCRTRISLDEGAIDSWIKLPTGGAGLRIFLSNGTIHLKRHDGKGLRSTRRSRELEERHHRGDTRKGWQHHQC